MSFVINLTFRISIFINWFDFPLDMKLIPSLRQKKRYIVFEIQSEVKFDFLAIKEEIDQSLLLFLGQLGLSRASPMWIKEQFNPQAQRFMLKVNNNSVDEVKTAVALSKKIKKAPIIIRSIITSGTVKKASSYLKGESEK